MDENSRKQMVEDEDVILDCKSRLSLSMSGSARKRLETRVNS
jgi:hypothetical protein